MPVLLIVCTVVLVTFAIKWMFRNKQLYAFGDKVTGPKAYPVVGSFHKLVFNKDEEQRFKLITSILEKYHEHKLVKVWLGPWLFIFVNDPELIQNVLHSNQCLDKSFLYKFWKLDNGLISAKHEKWTEHRKFLNNSFNDEIVQSFMPHFLESSNQMLKNLESQFSKEEFNILDVISKCTLTMLIGSTFGLNIEELQLNGDLLEAFDKLTKLVSKRCREPLLFIDPIYRFTRMFYRERKYRKTLSFYSELILKERRELVGPVNNNNNNTSESTSSKFIDEEMGETQNRGKMFIDQLICHEHKFTDDEIRDHVYSVVAAGYETTSLLTAYAVLLLAMHPKIQDRVSEEINNLLNKSNENGIDMESLQRLSYLDMVIKEIMRLFPVTPIIGRKTHEEMDLNELKFPKDVTLVISIFSLHRRKDIWGENAELFNPDHFLPENIAKRHPYSYIPFSRGSRNCLGNNYAMLAIKIMLVKLLKAFKVTTNLNYEDIKFKSDITLKICTDHLVFIQKR